MGAFLTSFLLTAVVTPVVILAARRLGWVSRPSEDRWSQRPTALMGGIAIAVGTALGWLHAGDRAYLAPLLGPAVLIFVLGLVDDRVRLGMHLKLIGQIAAASWLIRNGVMIQGLPPLLAMPLTMLWVVGITNALNLLDNMDGLAAGVGLIAALAMAGCVLQQDGPATATGELALAGGCAGFLLYNFHPARIFMGDCGSMLLGFGLAVLSLQGPQRAAPNLALSLLVPVVVLAIPIFDTTLVSLARVLHGRAISQGGRDHSSHRLVSLGLSERGTVLVFYGLSMLFGGLAVAAVRLSLATALSLAALLFAGLLVLGRYLGFLQVYHGAAAPPPQVRVLGGRLLYKTHLVQVLLDVQLAAIAFVGAHLLRLDGQLTPEARQALMSALPVVFVAKLLGLALLQAYRGVWRGAGMMDALAALGGSTVGSLAALAALELLPGSSPVPISVWIIDWLLFTLLCVAVRTGYIALRELFGLLPPRDGPRVVILGCGPEALTLIRKLRDPLSPRRAHVLGILDDEAGREGFALNGVPILGTLDDLERLRASHAPTCCLLGVAPLSDSGRSILERCAERKISVYQDLDAASRPDGEPGGAALLLPAVQRAGE